MKDLRSAGSNEMDEMTMNAFIGCTIRETNDEPINDAINDVFLYKVMKARVEHHNIDISAHCMVFLSLILSHNPASVVMWAYTAKKINEETGKTLDMELLANTFPMGFPDEEQRKNLWYTTKDDEGNNKLDIVKW